MAPRSRTPYVLAAGAAAAGLIARLVVLHSTLGTLDSDEAVVGLMARHFARGDFRAFYWGQPYGGTIEPALAAVVFRLLGSSTTALKSVPLTLDAIAALLTWRVGRRLTTATAAGVAAVLVWVWPATYLWWSLKERGFYEAGLCLTLVGALLALRIAAASGRGCWADWLGLGAAAGLGWWETPQVVYVLGPIALWLVWRLRAGVWRGIAAVPTLVLGALPWLWPNVQNGFASLRPPPSPVKGSYVDHLFTLAHVGAPMTVGLRVPYTTRWLHPAPLAQALFVATIALVAAGCLRRWPGGRLVGLVLACLPFLHALLPLAGTVAEGRYTLFALPWIALAIAHRGDHRVAAGVALGLASGVTVVGLLAMRGQTDPYAPDRHVPRSLASLERTLHERGVAHLWANYWVAYRLTFETRERTIAAPASSDRFPAYATAVGADPHAAHVFMSGSHTEAVFHAALEQRRASYDRWTAGPDWVVYVPSVPTGPTAIANTYP
ncbi:MAG: hypothetical protein NVSMB12_05100 [Acidimicrobiales bacterium]